MPKNPVTTANPDAALMARIAAQAAATDQRVSRLEHNDQIIWIKKQEKLSLRMRLQKGNARAAFLAERDAMQRLKNAGVPVPAVLAEGDDYFATADSGVHLKYLLQSQTGKLAERLEAFAAAGKQLALMHKLHLSHGRPSIKDICWKDGRITFLDFERFHEKRNTPKGHMQDLVMMVFSAYAVTGGQAPEIDSMIKSYREHDPAHIWERAVHWCHKMRWVDFATKPIQWRKGRKAREFKAIPLTLRAFSQD